MSIAGLVGKSKTQSKALAGRVPREARLLAVLLFACLASFYLGYLERQSEEQGYAPTTNYEQP